MKDRLERLVSPSLRLMTAFLIIPPYLLMDSVLGKIGLYLFLSILLIFSGKKHRMLIRLIMLFSILFFQFLSPLGRVLWQWGPLSFTAGALERGFLKGITFLGLMNISLISIRPGWVLPGRTGALITGSLYYFARFMELERRDKARGFGEIDRVLIEIYNSGPHSEETSSKKASTRGWWYPAVMGLFFWGSYILISHPFFVL